jgi:hypothetical protein
MIINEKRLVMIKARIIVTQTLKTKNLKIHKNLAKKRVFNQTFH